ncbi:MAG: TonB-dependent receptor plug domain-containing protein, partial [Pseudomonadales bacterium]|nr:TonB-dependent receptor plug domain-containing protein [Pseudomonadales bacterium]
MYPAKALLRSCCLVINGLILSTAVLAQDSSPDSLSAASTDSDAIEEVVVVGTRASPRSVTDSSVPVDVISANMLSKSGNTDMLELLKTSIPSFNINDQPISDAATMIRPANLRGLPADNTLILINGKRRHRGSVIAFQGGGVNDGAQGPDISVIPSIAIRQIEVLRDGA